MKLIIDIDENDYKYIKEKRAIRNEQMEDIFNGIYYGKPLQAELEEIKAEAEELIEHCDIDYEFEEIYGIKLVVNIINRRIAELKGENK